MAKPKKKTASKRKPFTASIHGEGFDIDVEIRSAGEIENFVDVFAQKAFKAFDREKTAEAPTDPTMQPSFASDTFGAIIGLVSDEDLDKMRVMVEVEQAKRAAEHPSH